MNESNEQLLSAHGLCNRNFTHINCTRILFSITWNIVGVVKKPEHYMAYSSS